jgi:hypothetical protein
MRTLVYLQLSDLTLFSVQSDRSDGQSESGESPGSCLSLFGVMDFLGLLQCGSGCGDDTVFGLFSVLSASSRRIVTAVASVKSEAEL